MVDTEIVAIVFDFDGLLMDTETTLVDGWRHVWAAHGLDLELDGWFWPGNGGNCTDHRLDRLAALVGPTFDRSACQARYEAYRRARHESLDFCPGIRDWLDEAARLGLRTAVASSSPRTWVREHLGRVGAVDRFDVIATGDEVAAPKPDPAVFRLALDRLGVAGRQAVAVEDTGHGVRAAADAGMWTVAIPNAFVDPAQVSAADLTLTSAAALPLAEVLDQLPSGLATRG
ncbi:HAD-IA family hydrolase [Solwaraspora sp. WMMD791]|uniref:HAD family hydrolase n=1 Tax=Solwaraspora sp. WMMD791 TaxID=3016086 RepID=UPI00249A6327|nr:HAD-IA family hydrolase [Solwaraspora sp. WMMD791]WFE28404.1 HAD-IA family hydrolase [Solwaraspora sp. WMMD791]